MDITITYMKYLCFGLLMMGMFYGCEERATENIKNTTQEELPSTSKNGPLTLVIHGGAGTILKENMSREREAAYEQKLKEALRKGYAILEQGGTSLDAVVASIQVMEKSELFNAGRGAVFTSAGTNELDASIMDGATGKAGAVAGVSRIKSPILAARVVMEKSPHVMMAGTGAEQFAAEEGLELVDPSYFFTESRYKALERIREQEQQELDHNGQASTSYLFELPDNKYSTVGCVALDSYGNLAAGTSTGGMTNKRYGRIGDSPIIGAGTYANNESCAVSATGHGEFFIRNVVAYDIAALMKYQQMNLEAAAKEVILKKLANKEGAGGIIAVDRLGNIAMPFNTPGMFRGYIKSGFEPQVYMYKE